MGLCLKCTTMLLLWLKKKKKIQKQTKNQTITTTKKKREWSKSLPIAMTLKARMWGQVKQHWQGARATTWPQFPLQVTFLNGLNHITFCLLITGVSPIKRGGASDFFNYTSLLHFLASHSHVLAPPSDDVEKGGMKTKTGGIKNKWDVVVVHRMVSLSNFSEIIYWLYVSLLYQLHSSIYSMVITH